MLIGFEACPPAILPDSNGAPLARTPKLGSLFPRLWVLSSHVPKEGRKRPAYCYRPARRRGTLGARSKFRRNEPFEAEQKLEGGHRVLLRHQRDFPPGFCVILQQAAFFQKLGIRSPDLVSSVLSALLARVRPICISMKMLYDHAISYALRRLSRGIPPFGTGAAARSRDAAKCTR